MQRSDQEADHEVLRRFAVDRRHRRQRRDVIVDIQPKVGRQLNAETAFVR